MKVRKGFVSNSSSSSFCVYGVNFTKSYFEKHSGLYPEYDGDIYQVEDKYKIDPEISLAIKEMMEQDQITDINEFSPYDVYENIAEIFNMSVKYDSDDRRIYIGREYPTLGGNETGNQFRNSVQLSINKIFPFEQQNDPALKCHHIEESWSN